MLIGRKFLIFTEIIAKTKQKRETSWRIKMDKIQLLQERKARIIQAGKEIREDIAKIIDENSFVELSAFSFSKNFL